MLFGEAVSMATPIPTTNQAQVACFHESFPPLSFPFPSQSQHHLSWEQHCQAAQTGASIPSQAWGSSHCTLRLAGAERWSLPCEPSAGVVVLVSEVCLRPEHLVWSRWQGSRCVPSFLNTAQHAVWDFR